MTDLAETLVDIARSENLRFAAIAERAKSDPIFHALHQCWLIATDISHDASPGEMDDALTLIQDIAAHTLNIRRGATR